MPIIRNDIPELIIELQDMNIVLKRISKSLAEKGAIHARDIAPLRSGALIQGIAPVTAQARGAKGRFEVNSYVLSRLPANIANNNPHGVPYHAWLEFGRFVKIHKPRRVQRYMTATAEWLGNVAANEAADAINKHFK